MPQGSQTAGYVYFIRNRLTGLTKIGLAKNVGKRLETLAYEHAGAALWMTIPTTDMAQTERWFHCFFADEHSRLEWFRLEDAHLRREYLRHLAAIERQERREGKSRFTGVRNPTRQRKFTSLNSTSTKGHSVMKLAEMYPSTYLAAADCEEEDLVLTIDDVKIELMKDGEQKPAVYFTNSDKPLILNKTNAKTIGNLYGDDTRGWRGKHIALYATEVEFQGKTQLGIRVRLKAPKAAKKRDDDGDPFADE